MDPGALNGREVLEFEIGQVLTEANPIWTAPKYPRQV
jgi:hypothetical protein